MYKTWVSYAQYAHKLQNLGFIRTICTFIHKTQYSCKTWVSHAHYAHKLQNLGFIRPICTLIHKTQYSYINTRFYIFLCKLTKRNPVFIKEQNICAYYRSPFAHLFVKPSIHQNPGFIRSICNINRRTSPQINTVIHKL